MTTTTGPETVYCDSCDEPVPALNRFCPTCGAANRGTFETLMRQVENPFDATTAVKPNWRSKRSLTAIAVGTGAVVALACAGVGVKMVLDQQQHNEVVGAAFSAAQTQLTDEAKQASAATTTAQLRNLAKSASAQATSFDTGLPALSEQESSDAGSLRAAFTAMGRLAELSTNTLDRWPSIRSGLDPALQQASNGDVHGTPAAGEALTAVNALVAKGNRRISAWNEKNTRVRDKQRADLANLNAYDAEVSALIDNYASMRDDTKRQLDSMRDAGRYDTTTARTMFSNALDSRRVVRDEIQSKAAPKGLASAQSEVTSAISSGMEAMSQLIAAIDANEASCAISSCNLFDQPSWDDFQSTSTQVTTDLDRSVTSWNAAVASARSTIKDRTFAGRPVI